MTPPDQLAILTEAERAVRTTGGAVLCQVVRAEGSTPGKLGWKLLVRADGSTFGNLGGGAFEAMVAADATDKLAGTDDNGPEVKRYYLTEEAVKGEATGMVCGGFLEVLLEPLGARPLLVICGGGPVGQAVAAAGDLAGFDCLVVDDRPTFRDPALFPAGATIVEVDREYRRDFLAEVARRELHVVVVTRCWDTDTAALVSVLRQAPPGLAYLGLMGSVRKVERVRREVEAAGRSLSGVDLHAPIGLGIGGDTPGEIAIDVLAEVIETRRSRASRRPRRKASHREPASPVSSPER